MGLPLIKNTRIITKGMADSEYRAIDALAQSDLAWFKYSPQHYFRRKELRPETPAMRFGTIFHTAILEPNKFKENYLTEPETVTIDGKTLDLNKRIAKHRDYLEAWRLDHSDKMILSEKDAENLTGMLLNIGKDKELVSLIEMGSPECVVTWEYRGRACKAKADLWIPDSKYGPLVIDFKKTQDASESGFTRSIYNYNYGLQSAWYLEGFEASRFFFVAVEEKSPNAIGKWDAELWLEHGKLTMDRYIDKLEECERTGLWPWYSGSSFSPIRPPTWMTAMNDEQE